METGIVIRLLAVDQTAERFRSVAMRAQMLPKSFNSITDTIKKSLPAISIGAIASAANNAIQSMGELSDRAADAGVSAEWMQKMVGAMGQIGIKSISVERLAQAMQKMTKATGEMGVEGFARVLGHAGRLGSESERLTFLQKTFGEETGLAFATIVRGGDESINSLINLAATYPAISDAAVAAGDAAADSMAVMQSAISAGFSSMLSDFIMGANESTEYLESNTKAVAHSILAVFKAVGDTIRALVYSIRTIFSAVISIGFSVANAVTNIRRAMHDEKYSIKDAIIEAQEFSAGMFAGFAEDRKREFGDLYNFSEIKTKTTKPTFDAMKKAMQQGGVAFRTEAEKANKSIVKKNRESIKSNDRGASFALAGSATARRIIAGGTPTDAAAADRATARGLPAILDAVKKIAAATGDSADALVAVEAV